MAIDVVEKLTDAPRCRMCVRPAWRAGSGEYTLYCGSRACTNRTRTCQRCGNPFEVNVGEAGTKYCSTACKLEGYHPTRQIARVRCAWCDGELAPVKGVRTALWPSICRTCLEPLRNVEHTLRAHHVPHERARALLTDPGCEVCGTDLLAVARVGHGQMRTVLVVDHDHACCPADASSCGGCVRGLLCRTCNSAAGLLKDSPANAHALGAYLEAWQGRQP